LDEFENVEFITSHIPPSWKDVKHPRVGNLNRWVNIDKYPMELAGWQLDIGVAPLRDNHFNRGKSNLRWLEYSALKVPTVMSPVRPFKESVKDGVTGLFASSEQEWYEKLKLFVTDADLRRKIGGSAYTKVKVDFNMDEIAKEYKGKLEEVGWTDQRWMQKQADYSATLVTQDGQQTYSTPATN
jgi:glycosyltransferase involved in cell wall biosynthesis